LDILVALGFREAEGGALVLPLTANPRHLEARKVELEAGLELLRKRVAAGEGGAAAAGTSGKDSKDPKKGGSKIPLPSKSAATATTATAATPAAASAAAAAAKEAKEEARLEAAKRKVDAMIADEKARRMKAETAMQQQVRIPPTTLCSLPLRRDYLCVSARPLTVLQK